MDRKPKTIFQLETPFTNTQWPETSPQNQDTILELLCSLLSPIGQYRATNTTPSKGKRSKKRKRKEDKSKGEAPDLSRPPPPEISSYVVVGLNSITRSLESLSQKSKALKSVGCEENDAERIPQSSKSGIENKTSDVGQASHHQASGAKIEAPKIIEEPVNDAGQSTQPQASPAKSEKSAASKTSQSLLSEAKGKVLKNVKPPKDAGQGTQSKSENRDAGQVIQSPGPGVGTKTVKAQQKPLVQDEHFDHHFSAIFVPRSSQPSILHAHLPQLVTTASLANPELPVTRLVQLPKGCDARLSEALCLPRVSFIGILDGAPHSKPLVDLVRDCVPEIEVLWLEEAKKSVYLPLKINAIESFAPVVKKEQKSA
ncbi:hypothetical protein N431DRAFT_348823 [Stipitochalara longipes BDJ]|nr:hypothetical protein N431DRAFT_348823 [Stipitochalara longipes BDJ]